MWTVSALNKKFDDVLGTYNSLSDPHLSEHFKKPSIRHHLLRAGLVTRDGKIVATGSPAKLHQERKLQLQALLNDILDKGFADVGQVDTFLETKRLEVLIKAELLQRAKETHLFGAASNRKSTVSSAVASKSGSGRGRGGGAKVGLSRQQTRWTRTNKAATSSKLIRRQRPQSSYGVRSRSGSEPTVDTLQSNELSASSAEEGESLDDEEESYATSWSLGEELSPGQSSSASSQPRRGPRKRPEVQLTLRFERITTMSKDPRVVKITQQISSGGNSFVVFNKTIRPKEVFNVRVHAHEEGQFALAVFIDDVRDLRISTCCGHKHAPGVRLGHFTIVAVDNGARGPCRHCRPPPPPPPEPPKSATPPPPTPPPPPVVRPPSSSSSGESIPEVDYQEELNVYNRQSSFEEYSLSEDEKADEDTVRERLKPNQVDKGADAASTSFNQGLKEKTSKEIASDSSSDEVEF